MTAPEPVCEYVEDVADGSMCICGIAKRLAQDVLDFGEGSAEFVRCSCAPGLCYAECTTASEAVR